MSTTTPYSLDAEFKQAGLDQGLSRSAEAVTTALP